MDGSALSSAFRVIISDATYRGVTAAGSMAPMCRSICTSSVGAETPPQVAGGDAGEADVLIPGCGGVMCCVWIACLWCCK